MVRQIVSLALIGLIGHAAFRIGSAYLSFMKFEDQVQEATLFAPDRPEDELREKILLLAAQYHLPVSDDSFSIRRENYHTYVTGWYTQKVEVLPRYQYPWKFAWSTDTLAIPGAGAYRPAAR